MREPHPFPESIADYRFEVAQIEYEPTSGGIRTLRQAGVMPVTKVQDGTVYIGLGGGYSTSKLSASARRAADGLLRLVHPENLRPLLASRDHPVPGESAVIDFDLDEGLRLHAIVATHASPR